MKYGHWSGHRSKIWQIRESELFRTSLSSILLLPKSKLKFRKLFGKLKIPRNSITNVSVAFQVNIYLLRFSFDLTRFLFYWKVWFWIKWQIKNIHLIKSKEHSELIMKKTKKTSELVFLTFWVGLFSDIAFESSWFIFLPVLSLEEDKDQQEVK